MIGYSSIPKPIRAGIVTIDTDTGAVLRTQTGLSTTPR